DGVALPRAATSASALTGATGRSRGRSRALVTSTADVTKAPGAGAGHAGDSRCAQLARLALRGDRLAGAAVHYAARLTGVPWSTIGGGEAFSTSAAIRFHTIAGVGAARTASGHLYIAPGVVAAAAPISRGGRHHLARCSTTVHAGLPSSRGHI